MTTTGAVLDNASTLHYMCPPLAQNHQGPSERFQITPAHIPRNGCNCAIRQARNPARHRHTGHGDSVSQTRATVDLFGKATPARMVYGPEAQTAQTNKNQGCKLCGYYDISLTTLSESGRASRISFSTSTYSQASIRCQPVHQVETYFCCTS